MKIKPSIAIWNYYKGDITPIKVVSAIGDRIGGYHISYSANELLKDLNFITPKGNVTKEAKRLLAWYLHEICHKSIEPVVVVDPTLDTPSHP